MKSIVLLKRVPDLVEDLEVDASGKALDADSVKLKLNEFDDHALEEALLLKESTGGEVTVMALDGQEVDKVLYTALAKGADRAMKITGVGEVDENRRLAKIFAEVIATQPHDLILTGVQAADDRDGQLGPMVAAQLEVACVSVVTGVEPGQGVVSVHKEYAGGVMAELEADLPVVLGIQAARQSPRYAPVSKVRQMQQSTTLDTVAGTGNSEGGAAVVVMTPPDTGEGAQMLESVDEVIEVLVSQGVI